MEADGAFESMKFEDPKKRFGGTEVAQLRRKEKILFRGTVRYNAGFVSIGGGTGEGREDWLSA
jgi:hypothetical protein